MLIRIGFETDFWRKDEVFQYSRHRYSLKLSKDSAAQIFEARFRAFLKGKGELSAEDKAYLEINIGGVTQEISGKVTIIAHEFGFEELVFFDPKTGTFTQIYKNQKS